MHKPTAAIAVAIVLAGPAWAETRNLSGFSTVGASGRYDVEITQAETYSVVVEGRDAGQVETSVDGQRLRIRQRGAWFGLGRRELDAVVRVSLPRVDGLAAAAGVEMTASSIATGDIDLSAAQGAQLSVRDLRATNVSLSAAQGGLLDAAGACESVDASAAMGGVIDADGLECATADVSAAMGGVVEVHARFAVDASAAMGGAIDVSGAPETRTASASMGGDINIH